MTLEQIKDYKEGYPLIWKQGKKRTQITFVKSNLIVALNGYNYGCFLIYFDDLELPTKRDFDKAIEEEEKRHQNAIAHLNATYKNLGVIN